MGFFEKIKKLFGLNNTQNIQQDKKEAFIADSSPTPQPFGQIIEIDKKSEVAEKEKNPTTERVASSAETKGINPILSDAKIEKSENEKNPVIVSETNIANKGANGNQIPLDTKPASNVLPSYVDGYSDDSFYRAMLTICHKSDTDFTEHYGILKVYEGLFTVEYTGSSDSVIIPEKVNGRTISVIDRYFDRNHILKNIIIPPSVRFIEIDGIGHIKNICFAPGSSLSSIKRISDYQSLYALERINLPPKVDHTCFFESVNHGFYKAIPADSVGVKRYNKNVVSASGAVDVLDCKNAIYVDLRWINAENTCKKVIITPTVKKIFFSPFSFLFLDEFEVRNNSKYIYEDGILYSVTASKKKMLFISPKRQDSVLTVGKDVVEIPYPLSKNIKTVIIESDIKLPNRIFDLKYVREIVCKNKNVQIKSLIFDNLDDGVDVYVDKEGVSKVVKKKQIRVHPLSDYIVEKDNSEEKVVAFPKPENSVNTSEKARKTPKTQEGLKKDKEIAQSAAPSSPSAIGKYVEKDLKAIERCVKRIEEIYPEHKIFAFSALMDDTRESLAKIAKANGLSGYDELLKDFGYEIITKEEVRALRSTVVYTPGNEPECIKGKVDNALKLLNTYYPDKIIEKAIDKEHKSLGGKITGLYQWLGYENIRSFLQAYGYDYQVKELFRVDDYAVEIIDYLRKKYKEKKAKNITCIYQENPEIENKIKTLSSTSSKRFGMEFGDYLVSIGVLIDKANEEREAFDKVIDMLKRLYPSGTGTRVLATLYKDNSELEELCMLAEPESKRRYGKTLTQYLKEIEILKSADDIMVSNFSDFEFNKGKSRIVKFTGSSQRVVIPAKITAVDKEAFAGSNVVEIVLEPHSALKNISDSAFENCKSLVTVDLSNSESTELKIGENAFKNCEKLEQIIGEWELVQSKKGAFEGCSNIFVRDGEYIYPRLWLYNILLGGVDCGAMPLEPHEITGDKLPYVKASSSYTNRAFEIEMQVTCNEIPVASDAGYGNVVMYVGTLETRGNFVEQKGLDENTASNRAYHCRALYMPNEKTVSYFVDKMVLNAVPNNELMDEDRYISLQRAFFERFNIHYSSIREELSKKYEMQRIDFSFDKEIIKPFDKSVYVTFIGHNGYQYRCAFDAHEGDVVYVDGSRAGDIGFVTDIGSALPEGDFYKNVIKVYRQSAERDVYIDGDNAIYEPTRSCFQFWDVVVLQRFREIYPELPILSSERNVKNKQQLSVTKHALNSTNSASEVSYRKKIKLYRGEKCLIRVIFPDSTESLCNCEHKVNVGEFVSVYGIAEDSWAKVVDIVGMMDETSPFVRGIIRDPK